MNCKFLAILVILVASFSCAKPSIIFQDFKTEQIIHYSQMKNIENISNYVVYLDKGDLIPLKIALDSEILGIADEEINLILKQKIYFRLKMPEGLNADDISSMSEEEKKKHLKEILVYLSPDAIRWAPYTDIKAVAQVFGIKGGSVSFGTGVTKEEGIKIFVRAKTNRM